MEDQQQESPPQTPTAEAAAEQPAERVVPPVQGELEQKVWREIAEVEDPELGFSVVELGLIYDLKIDDAKKAFVTMTFTSMACPVGPQLKGSVEAAARRIDEITDAEVEVVFSPPWDPKEMATEEIQEIMGIY